jgi:hypothetical protein
VNYNDKGRQGDRTPENAENSEVVSPPDGRMKPFPVDLLPDVVREYVVEQAEAIGVDVAMIAPAVLATLGGAIGTTRAVVVKSGWSEFPALWVAVVCESGAAKSPSIRAATQGIVKRQEREFHRHQKESAAYEAAMLAHKLESKRLKDEEGKPPPEEPQKPRLRSIFTNDATVEALARLLKDNPRGMVLIQDELVAFFGRMDAYRPGAKGADKEAYLSMYSSSTLRVDRKLDGVTFIPRPFLSIVGAATPEALRGRLSGDGNSENGLAARFLIVNPPRDLRLWSDAEVSPAVAQAFDKLVNELLDLVGELQVDFTEKPVYMGVNAQAQKVWRSWFNAHNGEAVALRGPLAASWSKLEAVCVRLALIMALAENPDCGTVNSEAVERAIGITEWFKSELIRWYDAQKESRQESELHRLALWVKFRGGEVTGRELMRTGPKPRAKTAQEAEDRLNVLAQAGLGRWRLEKSPAGGSPTHVFVLKGDTTPKKPEKNEVVSPVAPDEGEDECDAESEQKPAQRQRVTATVDDPAIPPEFDTAAFRKAWQNWILYRSDKRKPVSIRAAKQQLQTFARWVKTGSPVGDLIASIEQSIANDWQGLFEPKGSRQVVDRTALANFLRAGDGQGDFWAGDGGRADAEGDHIENIERTEEPSDLPF